MNEYRRVTRTSIVKQSESERDASKLVPEVNDLTKVQRNYSLCHYVYAQITIRP